MEIQINRFSFLIPFRKDPLNDEKNFISNKNTKEVKEPI